jgi:branched-chain amino acid transport system substrate-binding protein
VLLDMAYDMGTEDFSLHLERLKRERLDAIVHWGNDQEGAMILNQMRDMGMTQPYFACDRCLSDTFVKIAGDNVEGVVCTSPWNPKSDSPKLAEFRTAFSERYGEAPETFAAHAYDGMNMLIWSIQMAGLNRAKIRDVLAYRSRPWQGASGDIQLSAVHDDMGDVYLVTRENGQWHFHTREDLEVPQGHIPPRDRVNRSPATTQSK